MFISFLSGAFAGLVVDTVLFPIDTIKTRLQSNEGFLKAGGFRGVYDGLGSAVLGSVPSASVFFLAYETSKSLMPSNLVSDVYLHMIAGCMGEIFACVARIPFEVIKQTAQAQPGLTSLSSFRQVLSKHGIRGLFTGYFSMVFRDVPFSVIQMPIWEFFKSVVSMYLEKEVTSFESGICGFIAGGITGAITTPLDVAKTRIILSQGNHGPLHIIMVIAEEEGISGLFSGILPRVIGTCTGGFIFFGAYEFCKNFLTSFFKTPVIRPTISLMTTLIT